MANPPTTNTPQSAGQGLSTGDNGFPIDGQKYTFDTGVPDAQGGAQGPFTKGVDTSKSFVDASGKPKDLSAPTRKTLGQYLSKVTLGQEGSVSVPNRYPVDGTDVVTTSTTDEKGFPGKPETPPVNNTFAGNATQQTNPLSPSFPTIASVMKKGKSSVSAVDGNDLLAGVPGTGTYTGLPGNLVGDGTNPSPLPGHADTSVKVINPYTSAVLSTNRFTGASAAYAAAVDVANPPASYDPTFPEQKRLGVHDVNTTTFTAGRLANIGSLLSLRAATTLGAASPGADPNSGGLEAASLLPGLGQLGVQRVDQRLLLASDILSTLTTDEPPAANVTNIAPGSWGNLNDPNDPFSGTDALGMLTLSVALVAGLEVVIDALSVLLGLITPSVKAAARDPQGRYSLGEYYPGSKKATRTASGGIGGFLSALTSLNFGALLGLQPTNFPFNRALTTGLNAFFGIQDNTGGAIGLNQLAGALTSSTDSPGFNVVVARTIIRSSISITDALKKVGGNVMNAANAVLSLVDTIRTSKIVAACNVFAMLGDAQLSNPDAFIDPQATGGVKVSQLDNDDDVIRGAVGKSRLKNSLKLAWASNTAPANLLLPASVFAASLAVKGLGQPSPFIGIQTDPYSQVQSTVTQAADNGRISNADALVFEDKLEASYVPFYFHDLRTNEMVSFHAFLAALNDDYNAAYEKFEGYGRVDPVRIYRSTERRITMSFYIAATSLPDFDEMWVKINKLVTLVYPQYTKGVQLASPDGSSYVFTQPFSQLIGASPLIRLRLGDLLRSNYSLFALGRLFGMGNSEFTVNGQKLTGAETVDQDVLNNISQQLAKALANPNDELYHPTGNAEYPFFADNGSGIGISVPVPSIPGLSSNNGPQFAPTFNPARVPLSMFVAKAVKVDPDNSFNLICEIELNPDPAFRSVHSKELAAADKAFNNSDLPLQKVIGGRYSIPATALVPTDETTSTAASKITVLQNLVENNSTFAQDLGGSGQGGFLDPGGNALAKSFADTGGKGLAGFIESLSFDFYDRVTWETSAGRIAPKICKVNLTFSPVHDISPGLDHLGFSRASQYPIGVLQQR